MFFDHLVFLGLDKQKCQDDTTVLASYPTLKELYVSGKRPCGMIFY